MKASGAVTVAQDQASSIVCGIPREAIERRAAHKVVALEQIPGEILRARAAG
jgi:two-component system chemotaxis response regulator CheB